MDNIIPPGGGAAICINLTSSSDEDFGKKDSVIATPIYSGTVSDVNFDGE
jgi:hypothetical protein